MEVTILNTFYHVVKAASKPQLKKISSMPDMKLASESHLSLRSNAASQGTGCCMQVEPGHVELQRGAKKDEYRLGERDSNVLASSYPIPPPPIGTIRHRFSTSTQSQGNSSPVDPGYVGRQCSLGTGQYFLDQRENNAPSPSYPIAPQPSKGAIQHRSSISPKSKGYSKTVEPGHVGNQCDAWTGQYGQDHWYGHAQSPTCFVPPPPSPPPMGAMQHGSHAVSQGQEYFMPVEPGHVGNECDAWTGQYGQDHWHGHAQAPIVFIPPPPPTPPPMDVRPHRSHAQSQDHGYDGRKYRKGRY